MTFEEASNDENWIKDMVDDIHSIKKNDTWELTNLSIDKRSIGVRWVYKTKCIPNGEMDRCKARLVEKGYKQKPGIYYFEVFAPVGRLDKICKIIYLWAQNDWKIYQMDVKSTFFVNDIF